MCAGHLKTRTGSPARTRRRRRILWAGLWLGASAAQAAQSADLLAEWKFDGEGGVAEDSSGRGHHGTIHGATRVVRGNGFALSLDGLDDYVDCGKGSDIGIGGPTTIEAWVKPMAKSQGLASLFGEGLKEYLVAYYTHAELVYFFVGSGGNKVYQTVQLREWNHVAATFDGTQMNLWLNGRLAATRESEFQELASRGHFLIGTRGRPDLPKYRGLIDHLRVYDRALPGEEIVSHFKDESPAYGRDPAWFNRLKATPYFYPDEEEIVVEADYRGLQPFRGKARLDVTLSGDGSPDDILVPAEKDIVNKAGVSEARFACEGLAPGAYTIRVALTDGDVAYPVEELRFEHPPAFPPLPSPALKTVAPLPPATPPVPFELVPGAGGGFALQIKGAEYPFHTRVSWPHGEFNHLWSGGEAPETGEESWTAAVRTLSGDQYEVEAEGAFYRLHRAVEVFPTHVYVKDTYTNKAKEDLGLLVYNELAIRQDELAESRLGGFERGGRLNDVFCPSVFVVDDNTGIGLLPIDDVYVIQSLLYIDPEAAGVGTEKLALAPGGTYTLEWAVYPTGSGDYYDFINAFRTVEDRISTIDGGLGFFTHGPKNRDQIPSREFLDQRGIKYGLVHNLAGIVDDPELSIQGIEYLDFPRERERLKKQMAEIHALHPDLKVLIHIAHSLYCTDTPGRFPDAQTILPDGKQNIWGVPHAYISEARQNAGWKFWIFYPTPGNRFHDAMMRSVDVLIDEMGIDGGFMDGFFAGYGGRWTYDGRWDGYSAEIDAATKTLTRKLGSVLLLSQPSMIAYCRKMRDKGGFIVANNTVVTRSLANEKYIIHDSESGAGPQLHLAPNLSALANPARGKTKKDVYLNALENLRWGELFIYYGGHFEYADKPLPARQFPMTFREIGAGYVKGPERIVTMNSGVVGWTGERDLHRVYKYDARGRSARHDFVTTADPEGVRTELAFARHESAVIEPIPVVWDAGTTANARVIEYGENGLHLWLNGRGPGILRLRPGAFAVAPGKPCRVAVDGKTKEMATEAGTVSVPLELDGATEVVIRF